MVIILVIIEILLYDWGIFELGYLNPIVNLLKIIIPICLIGIAGFATGFRMERGIHYYILFFILFSIYTVIPTFISENIAESISQYIKIIPPRIFFIIALACLFSQDPSLMTSINRVLFAIGLLTFFQFILAIYYVNIHPFEDTNYMSDRGGAFAGPFGLYGNVVTQFILPAFQAVRLTGFWVEPSNASGFLISIYFVGLGLRKKSIKWGNNLVYFIPLLAGLLTLSSAGYISFAIAYCMYLYICRKQSRKKFIGLLITMGIMVIGFFGRFIYTQYFPDDENMVLRAILGVRDLSTQGEDFTGGRINNYTDNLKVIKENPLGIGFRIPGEDAAGKGFKESSASAIFYLATFTGMIGLILIVFMKTVVISNALKLNRNNLALNLPNVFFLCAWIAISMQNIIYGTWLSFFYFYISIMTIISFCKTRLTKQLIIS